MARDDHAPLERSSQSLGSSRPHRHRPADHRRRLRRRIRGDGARRPTPAAIDADRRRRQEALPGELRHLPRPRPAGHRRPARRSTASASSRSSSRSSTGRMPLQMQGPQAPQKPVAVHRGPDQGDGRLRAVRRTRTDLSRRGGPRRQGRRRPRRRAVPHQLRDVPQRRRAPAARSPRASTPRRCTTTSALHMYAAMVTGPQNMPVFNDMNLTTRGQARHHLGTAVPAGERVARRILARFPRPGLRGPVHLDLRHRRTDRHHRVDHGEVELIDTTRKYERGAA